MEVPAWVFVILACFSSILIVVACLFVYFFVRYRLRSGKYKRIPEQKYVAGKTAAYFCGKYDYSASLPLAYPTALQYGTPVTYPSLRVHQNKAQFSRHSSFQSPQSRSSKHQNQSWEMNRASSLDDRLFRASFTIKPGESKSYQNSPLADPVKDQESIADSVTSAVKVEEIQRYPDEFLNYSPQRPDEYGLSKSPTTDTDAFFYSHSDFISEDDSYSNAAGNEADQVVSYDQDFTTTTSTGKRISYLAFALEYQPTVPKLEIMVKHAFDLQPVSDQGPSGQVNSYVNLCIVPEDFLWQRTKVVKNDQDPVFNEKFEIRDVLYHKLREYTLCFYVMDSHPVLGERVIGKVLYPLSELRAEQVVDVCKELSPA